MTMESPSADPQHSGAGVPVPVVDESSLLTRPAFGTLVAEISADPRKLDEVRLLVLHRGERSDEELRQDIGRVYGRDMTLQETLSLVEMLS